MLLIYPIRNKNSVFVLWAMLNISDKVNIFQIVKGGVRIYSDLTNKNKFYHPSCFFLHIENLDVDIKNVDSFIGATGMVKHIDLFYCQIRN